MKTVKVVLALSTVAIYGFTLAAIANQGFNWPMVAIGDLLSLNWRSQFNFDFIIHLLLLAAWVIWREGATAKAYLFGALSVVMGGMFSFSYLVSRISYLVSRIRDYEIRRQAESIAAGRSCETLRLISRWRRSPPHSRYKPAGQMYIA